MGDVFPSCRQRQRKKNHSIRGFAKSTLRILVERVPRNERYDSVDRSRHANVTFKTSVALRLGRLRRRPSLYARTDLRPRPPRLDAGPFGCLSTTFLHRDGEVESRRETTPAAAVADDAENHCTAAVHVRVVRVGR